MDKAKENNQRGNIISTIKKALTINHSSKSLDTKKSVDLLEITEDYNKRNKLRIDFKYTHTEMSWYYLESLLKDIGFKVGLRYDFKHEGYVDEAVLYYNPEKGLIIWCDSFNNKNSMNDGTLYGMLDIKRNNKEEVYGALRGCSHRTQKNGAVEFSYSIRNGLLYKINELESCASFRKQWTGELPHLWLVDFSEISKINNNLDAINMAKIERLPQEAKNILNIKSARRSYFDVRDGGKR